MNIGEKFEELKEKREKALIAYICAGDPTPEATPKLVEALVKGGTDMVEIGLPFSDPIADGLTIQGSIERALNAGMNPDKYFEVVKGIQDKVPLIVMTYYNLIFKRGLKKFIDDCVNSHISGIIVPDLPVEESDELAKLSREKGVDLIFLIAPTTTEARIKKITQIGTGFIYLVARLGVTGARKDIADSTKKLLSRVNARIPKAIGFGISNADQAEEIARAGADGIIVGSAFVDIIAERGNIYPELEALAKELKDGIIRGS